jgi:outer membrane protein assembly factor BamB
MLNIEGACYGSTYSFHPYVSEAITARNSADHSLRVKGGFLIYMRKSMHPRIGILVLSFFVLSTIMPVGSFSVNQPCQCFTAQDGLSFPVIAFPNATGMFEHNGSIRQIEVAPTGGIFTVGYTNDTNLLLIKWNESLSVEWYRELSGPISAAGTGGAGLACANGYVYTVARALKCGVFLAKWSSKGDLIWSKATHFANIFPNQTQGINYPKIAVSSDGSIYIIGGIRPLRDAECTLLAKFNSTGSLLWNRTLSMFPNLPEISMLSSNEIVAMTSHSLLKFSSVGDLIWNRTCRCGFSHLDVSPLGTIYTVDGGWTSVNIARWTNDGNIGWSYVLETHCPQEIRLSSAYPSALVAAADDSAYIYFKFEGGAEPTVMVKVGPNGQQEWNRSLDYQSVIQDGMITDIDVSHTGMIYASSLVHGSIPVLVYVIGEFTPLIPMQEWATIAFVAVGGITITVLVIITLWRRRPL